MAVAVAFAVAEGSRRGDYLVTTSHGLESRGLLLTHSRDGFAIHRRSAD